MSKQYDITVRLSAETPEECMEIAQRLQSTVTKVDSKTFLKMLKLLEKNPRWINTATKAVKFM